MNSLHGTSLASLVASSLAWPTTALAANWQPYLLQNNIVHEIDVDSLQVAAGVVTYKARSHVASETLLARFAGGQGAAADCAGRRHAEDIGGYYGFTEVTEGSKTAAQVDMACRLAGLATTPGQLPDWQPLPDDLFIDVNSMKVRDGLLFFSFRNVRNRFGEAQGRVVVECATRKRSEVVGVHYNLQRIVEGGQQARQFESACRFAHQPTPPAPSIAPVDFDETIAPENAGDDNLLHDILRSGMTERDGLVRFKYATRLLTDGSQAQEDQLLDAVVDCAGKRRADEVAGRFELRPVRPGTRGALQVARVCGMTETAGKNTTTAGKDAGAASSCRYVRVGSVPIEWQGARLRVSGSINGTPVPMIVDTGAYRVMIPHSLVEPLGLPVVESLKGESYGGGGVSKISAVRTSRMSVGDVRNVGQLMIVDLDSTNRDVLVGDDFLFQHDLELNDHEMVFFAPPDCRDASLAYWDALAPFAELEPMDESNPQPIVRVAINGRSLRALIDTGAPNSLVDLAAARRLGIDPPAQGVKPYATPAIGTHRMTVWPPQDFESFDIGGEIVRHPRLAISDIFGNARREMPLGGWKLRNAPDMILGADFLRAHRLLFARGQHRLYLSYTGGNVFDAPTESELPPPHAAPAAP